MEGARPRRIFARQVAAEELQQWIAFEDENLLVLDKPADLVCHPSKAGPASSLVGALRLYRGLEHPHLVCRLDRETSGLVLFAKTPAMAGRLQKAAEKRRIGKEYDAILTGHLPGDVKVDQPLGDDGESPVTIRTKVRLDGRPSITHFHPHASGGGFTLVRVRTETGRKHQIRAHAHWLGHPIVGDKIYGPDARLYLQFISTGWTESLARQLLLPRQALHCSRIDLTAAGVDQVFRSELPQDLVGFCRSVGLVLS